MTCETLVNIDQTTQRNNPEDRNLHKSTNLNIRHFKSYSYEVIGGRL
jgi:hypothetical protein